jgi:hypothetical protein
MGSQFSRFRAWVEDVGGVAKAAKLLNVSVSFVSRVYHETRTPGRALASRIEKGAGLRVVDLESTPPDEMPYSPRLPASGWDE